MKAVLEIKTKHPKALMDAISVDEIDSQRVRAKPNVIGDALVVEIEAEEFAALRAGVTSYMRLVKTALAGFGEG